MTRLCLLALVLFGCATDRMVGDDASDTSEPDGASDAMSDVGIDDTGDLDTGSGDVGGDAMGDVGADATGDTGADATPDTGADVGVDAESDVGADAGTDSSADAVADMSVDAGSCAEPTDFGERCFGDEMCMSGVCWASPLAPGGCVTAGCSSPCSNDEECRCKAAEAGADDPNQAACIENECDLTDTGLGGITLCT